MGLKAVSVSQGSAFSAGIPVTLHRGGIPLIGLSSGSVAANGAISGITALPRIYPDAYCYFPANILATSIAAGWYYCTFSTTTAGVAFLDTYTSGVPTIPTSPTPVTDGKGAFTGDTSEEVGIIVSIPALAANSVTRYEVFVETTNNANSKQLRIRESGGAGTQFISQVFQSVTMGGSINFIANNGSVSKQDSGSPGIGGGGAPSIALGTVNRGVATTGAITLTRATATDNFILLPPIVQVLY